MYNTCDFRLAKMLVGVPPNPPEASGHRDQKLPCLRPRRWCIWALRAYSATTSESLSSSSESGSHKSMTSLERANATGRRTQMRRCLNTARGIFTVVGTVGSAVMLLFTRQLAAAMNNTLAYWPIKCLGISVVCVSVMCAYRGFAQGQQNMVPTATSQFIEAFFKLVGLVQHEGCV